MTDDLDDRLCAHYEAQSLEPESLDRLKAIARGDLLQLPWWRRVLRTRLVAAAAILLIGLGGWWWFGWFAPQQSARKTAHELAETHSLQLPLEVEETNWDRLGKRLPKLDFQPVKPMAIDLEANNYRLVGARYCTVRGLLAIQIRLVHETHGGMLTLYQFRPDDTPLAIGDEARNFEPIDGVRVILWQEQGLVMGLARYGEDIG